MTQRAHALVKLTGTIRNYKCTRAEAAFVFTDNDRTAMGVLAIAAGIAGLGGQAVSTAANTTATEEDADYVEFDLGDQQVKGWVWRSPLKEEDSVEVAAQWRQDHYELAGIARPADRTVALYPHCSRGRATHIKNAAKWWILGTTGLTAFSASALVIPGAIEEAAAGLKIVGLLALFAYGLLIPLAWLMWGLRIAVPIVAAVLILGGLRLDADVLGNEEFRNAAAIGLAAWYAFFGLMTFSLARKWMPFVHLAEKVFTTLGIPDPRGVDLVKSSKAQRKPGDPDEYSTFYFRY